MYVCVLGGATGPALETDPHSTSLASSSHAHVESSVKKKKKLFSGESTSPTLLAALKQNTKLDYSLREKKNHIFGVENFVDWTFMWLFFYAYSYDQSAQTFPTRRQVGGRSSRPATETPRVFHHL